MTVDIQVPPRKLCACCNLPLPVTISEPTVPVQRQDVITDPVLQTPSESSSSSSGSVSEPELSYGLTEPQIKAIDTVLCDLCAKINNDTDGSFTVPETIDIPESTPGLFLAHDYNVSGMSGASTKFSVATCTVKLTEACSNSPTPLDTKILQRAAFVDAVDKRSKRLAAAAELAKQTSLVDGTMRLMLISIDRTDNYDSYVPPDHLTFALFDGAKELFNAHGFDCAVRIIDNKIRVYFYINDVACTTTEPTIPTRTQIVQAIKERTQRIGIVKTTELLEQINSTTNYDTFMVPILIDTSYYIDEADEKAMKQQIDAAIIERKKRMEVEAQAVKNIALINETINKLITDLNSESNYDTFKVPVYLDFDSFEHGFRFFESHGFTYGYLDPERRTTRIFWYDPSTTTSYDLEPKIPTSLQVRTAAENRKQRMEAKKTAMINVVQTFENLLRDINSDSNHDEFTVPKAIDVERFDGAADLFHEHGFTTLSWVAIGGGGSPVNQINVALFDTEYPVTTLAPKFPTRAQITAAVDARTERIATKTTGNEILAGVNTQAPKTLTKVFSDALETIKSLPEPSTYYVSDEQITLIKKHIDEMMLEVLNQATLLPVDSDYLYKIPKLVEQIPSRFLEGVIDSRFFVDHGLYANLKMDHGKVGVSFSLCCDNYPTPRELNPLIPTRQALLVRANQIGDELRAKRVRKFVKDVLSGEVVPVPAVECIDKNVVAYPYGLSYGASNTMTNNHRQEQTVLKTILENEYEVANVVHVLYVNSGDSSQMQLKFKSM